MNFSLIMKCKLLLSPMQSHINLFRNKLTINSVLQRNSFQNVVGSPFHTSSAMNNQSTPIPRLMNSLDMKIMKPSLLKIITNKISANFIITPYFDNEFNLEEFKAGAEHAIVAVSSALANGNTTELEGVIDKDALAELKRNFGFFSAAQRQELAIDPDDILRAFIYEIGIMFDDNKEGVQEQFVEITFCAHIMHGLSELAKGTKMSLKEWLQHGDRGTMVNYRFIREFTTGVEGQWVINYVDYFKL